MFASLKAEKNYFVLIPGILTLLLGGVVLFGWEFGFSLLTRVSADWKPMVPSTALCFIFSAIALLKSKASSDQSVPVAQSVFVWLTLLVAALRAVEILFNQNFGIQFLLPGMNLDLKNLGSMSPQTVAGFLLFGTGMLLMRWVDSIKVQMLTGLMAIALLMLGLLSVIGYWLDFQLVFEEVYIKTGALWMAFHTAVGMFLLGMGLLCIILHCKPAVKTDTIATKSSQIIRTTLLVLAATAITTGLVGISYLEETITKTSSSSLKQLVKARIDYLDNNLDNRTQRALVASLDPDFRREVSKLLRNPGNKQVLAQAKKFAEALFGHGFTGVAIEHGNQQMLIAGRILPARIQLAHLNGSENAALAWDKGYILRVRIPLSSQSSGGIEGSLILEQALPHLEKVFSSINHFGRTGTMPMCTRLDDSRLLCFPQREQADMYIVPDHYAGKPLPMTRALAGQYDVATLVDYRGRKVLSAFGPVGTTGLGLVLRMDMVEVLSPVRDELLLALPLIASLIVLGLLLIRGRVRPLISDITEAYAAENIAKARFDAAMESSPDAFMIGSCIRNSTGDIVDFRCDFLNRQAVLLAKQLNKNLSDKIVENMEGHSYLEIFPDQVAMISRFRDVVQTGQLQLEEFSLPEKEGTNKWFERQIVPMMDGVAVTHRDITQEKLLVQQLEHSTRLREAIVEGAAYSIISTDIDGTILTFNKAAERMLWYQAEELIGKSTPGVFHDAGEVRERAESLSQELGHKVEPGFEVFVAKAKIEFQEEREWIYVRKDGSRLPVRLSVTALRDQQGGLQGFLGIAYDISEQKRAEEYIRHIALHDVLTGLPNRALLDDRLQAAVEQQHRNKIPFALSMVDIDRFKTINDSMGHHIGDMILKEFVIRVENCLRPTDTLARMGGDEFVLLLSDTDVAGVRIVMERIKTSLVAPINVGLQEVHISASIGISLSPEDGDDMNELMRRADVAMYWVKENGRNGYKVFSREMDRGGTERLSLERDLHHALENDGFSLFYQPKVDLKSNTIFGIEALIRLHSSNGHYISPTDFIPLAEDVGLIVPIGKWILETACQDAIRLQQLLGARLNVAVNISPRQFTDGGLVAEVKDVIKRTGLDAGLLELEITEGVLMDERYGVSVSLSELNVLGVKIAIDDFGTGYSSLGYLKRFPISTLKIDQSFVRDLTSDSEDAALISAIIAMGHSLNIPVVAEGIESAEQLAFLAEHQCEMGQGFYIAHPMAFDALLQWFASDSGWHLDAKN